MPKEATKRNKRARRNRSQTEGDRTPKRRMTRPGAAIPQPISSTTRRPFSEVIKDNLIVALASVNGGITSPVVAEWGAIETKLAELVMEHVLSSKDRPVPRFDSGEIHRGYRIIKCMDGFSKEFLGNCITAISDSWDGLSLKLIPAEEIPLRPRARVWLPKMVIDNQKLLECLKLQNPQVPMDEWSIIRAEEPRENSMSLVLAISESSVAALENADNKLFFGVRKAKVKVFRPSRSRSRVDADDVNVENIPNTNSRQDDAPPSETQIKNDAYDVNVANIPNTNSRQDDAPPSQTQIKNDADDVNVANIPKTNLWQDNAPPGQRQIINDA